MMSPEKLTVAMTCCGFALLGGDVSGRNLDSVVRVISLSRKLARDSRESEPDCNKVIFLDG